CPGGARGPPRVRRRLESHSTRDTDAFTLVGSPARDERRHARLVVARRVRLFVRPPLPGETRPPRSRSNDDDAVRRAIAELHGLGLKVMLKPHVDVEDGTWRAQITPTD